MQVRANQSIVVSLAGSPTAVREGQPFDDSDEVVREFPWLFDRPVEEATARPGERRNISKP